MIKSCFIIINLILCSGAMAECLACWSLKKFNVFLLNGTDYSGYIRWYDIYDVDITDGIFIEDLFHYSDHIPIYTKLKQVKHPINDLVVSIQNPIMIRKTDIKFLYKASGKLDDYTGIGEIPIISRRFAATLMRKPTSMCRTDKSVSLSKIYWISYKPWGLKDDQIEKLCEEPWVHLIEQTKHLEENDVLRFGFLSR